MFRSNLLRSHPFPLVTILALMLGLCLSVSSADCYAAGETGHCGASAHATAHENHHEAAAVAQVSERHNGAGHALHAAAPESCPVGPSPSGSGHQCSHHKASGADDDHPSLYCNCHAKHNDGRAGHSVHETSCLAPRIAAVDSIMPKSPSSVLAEGFLMTVFLDPVEKPPTLS